MKFYLVKDRDAKFGFRSSYDSTTRGYKQWSWLTLAITPVDKGPLAKKQCELLKELLEKENSADEEKFRLIYEDAQWYWFALLDLEISTKGNSSAGVSIPVDLIIRRSKVFTELAGLFEGAQVKVDLAVFKNEDDPPVCSLSTKEMTFLPSQNDREDRPLFKDVLKVSSDVFTGGSLHNQPLNARVTITVTISDDQFLKQVSEKELMPLPRTILEEELFSDVTLVCDDGTEIRANRCFLVARSSVFRAMLQTDMKEARESTVQIPHMEARSVRAFLKILYYGDTWDAKMAFPVAFEVYKAGHKYDVKLVEEKMKEVIVSQPSEFWMDLDHAVNLFLFVRNLTPVDEELKIKAMTVMELFSETLEKCPEMQELLQTNYQAALELVKYFAVRSAELRGSSKKSDNLTDW